jgi:hypothetical protein
MSTPQPTQLAPGLHTRNVISSDVISSQTAYYGSGTIQRSGMLLVATNTASREHLAIVFGTQMGAQSNVFGSSKGIPNQRFRGHQWQSKSTFSGGPIAVPINVYRVENGSPNQRMRDTNGSPNQRFRGIQWQSKSMFFGAPNGSPKQCFRGPQWQSK